MAIAIIFLFFLQLITELIETTYAFGLLQTSIPPEVASVLFLLTPAFLLLTPRQASRGVLLAAGWTVLLSRALSVLLDTRGRMMLSGLGVGAFLLFWPMLLGYLGQKGNRAGLARQLTLSAALAVLASIILRSVYSGNDISGYGVYRIITWALIVAGVWLLPRFLQPASTVDVSNPTPSSHPGFGRLAALCLGIISVFTLLYFAFASPGVISRWTGANYLLVVALAAFAAAVFIVLWAVYARFQRALTPGVILVWNLVFIVSLVGTLWLNQVRFPAAISAYPVLEPPANPLSLIGLLVMLISYPVIFVNLALFIQELLERQPTLRKLGGAFLLAVLYLLLIILAQVFTTVYDYIPVIGPLFRDRFWLVFKLAAVIMILPLAFSYTRLRIPTLEDGRRSTWLPVGAFLAAAVSLAGAALLIPNPPLPAGNTSLRILTYNIQQGYNESGEKDFPSQLDLIRQAEPDIIGLQETDTDRVAGGNSDVVRYLADRLDMYSYYGPKTVTGTFGIALLSRYPIQNPSTFFMHSKGEQTAAIEADVTVGSQTLHILVTHLGNGGPIIQQQQVLQMLAGQENVIAVGDFNFRPDTEQYALTTRQLSDAWLAAENRSTDPESLDASRRIDHVFVSPGIRITQAEYLGPGPSDHPAMLAELAW